MLVTIVAGARPNFIKIAPIIKVIEEAEYEGRDIQFRLVHTGQHYDKRMSDDFFEQLGIPDPDVNLECGGGTQAEQTAAIMVRFEKELLVHRPDLVLVVGDVTSTMACAITAKKLGVDVAHVEAGIRSGDMSMPEEINRILTDSICDHFFTTTVMAGNLLVAQQVPENRIHFVGNTMIDTLYQQLDNLQKPFFWDTCRLAKRQYFLLTLHRPSNVDDHEKLAKILDEIVQAAGDMPVVFPVHPRTKVIIDAYQIDTANIILAEPLPYLEFIYLVKNAGCIITDSGGITEEATVLNVPCLTLRNNTERPETVLQGTNELVGEDFEKMQLCLQQIKAGRWKETRIPKYWDGFAADRIVAVLLAAYAKTFVRQKVY